MSIKVKVNGQWVNAGGGSAPIPATGVQDVKINNSSVVTDNVAYIPVINGSTGMLGMVRQNSTRGISFTGNGEPFVVQATEDQIKMRNNSYAPVTSSNLDYAVKSSMCDEKGAAWSDTEKAAAKDRLGITHYVPCYTNVTQLGLTLPCSTIDIVKAMPNNSMAMITAEVIASSITDVPWSYGVLSIRRGSSVQRTDIEYKQSSGAGGTLRGFASFNSNTDTLTWYKYTATQV